jgi:hypothetical protein
MPVISLRRHAIATLLAICGGGGFGFTMLALAAPQLFLEYPFLKLFVWLWLALVGTLLFVIVKRILGDDPVPDARHERASTEERPSAAARREGYSRARLTEEAQLAEVRARREAEERQGVQVVFKNSDKKNR